MYNFNELRFFCTKSLILIAFSQYISFSYTDHLIVIQLKDWNDLVYLPRLIILFYVIYSIRNYNIKELLFYLIICCIVQHIVLLLTHAGSRYAYFAWLLTFILFIKISYDNNHLNKISEFFNIKKLYTRKNR